MRNRFLLKVGRTQDLIAEMDPLFKAYGTANYRERDLSIRCVEERDIPAVAELFRLNYGDGYISPSVYDGTWVKRSIHSDDIICLVLEANGRVLATGSVVLNTGDYNDKAGEMSKLAVHPDYTLQGFGRRVIQALFKVAENSLEFAYGECRTAHSFSQAMFDEADFAAIGFLPQYRLFSGIRRESTILYAQLHGYGPILRSARLPVLIPEASPLASAVLRDMSLPTEFEVITDPPALKDTGSYSVRPLDRDAVGPLLRIPYGRVIEPLLFGSISIERGFSFVRDKAQYLVAYDKQQRPVGALGYQVDHVSKLVNAIELIAEREDVWPTLCRGFLRAAKEEGAEIVSVEVSAYHPTLQLLLHDLGFRSVAYSPAMVFHGTERLDVLRMMKLYILYDLGNMYLTESARKMVSLVETNFLP